MKKFLIACDFLGYSPTLHIRSKTSYNSLFSGFLSMVVIIVSLLCTGYFSLDLILKSTPSVIVTRDTNDDFGPLEVSNKDFIVILGVQDTYASFYIDPTIYEFTARAKTIEYVDSENGKIQQVTVTDLKTSICSEFFKKGDFQEDNIEISLEQVYCIRPNSTSIRGFWGSKGACTSIMISIDKCQNSTINNNHCKTPDEIDQAIQNGYISMDYSIHQVDQNNNTNPLKKIFYDDYNLLNANSSLLYAVELTPIKFKSDEGMIFPDIKEFDGVDHHVKVFNQNTRSNNIVSLSFQGSPISTVYMRGYIKLQTVITQIGGFIKFIMLGASILSQIFSKYYYFSDVILNNVIDPIKPNQEKVDDRNSNINMINFNNASKNKNFLNYRSNEENKINEMKNSTNSPRNNPGFVNKSPPNNIMTPIKKIKENSITIVRQEVLKSNSSMSIMFDYLWNKILIFRKEENKGLNFRMLKNFENLYRKVTSIDIMFEKFYEIEALSAITLNSDFNLDDMFKQALLFEVSSTNSNAPRSSIYAKTFV